MTTPQGPSRPPSRSFLAGAALVLAGIGAIFHRVLFAGELFVGRDTLLVYYPVAKFWAERVRAWDFPEWYPYDALGQPFIGMVISGALHPSKLLYLVFPLGTAHSLNTLLCYPLAVGGVFLCARALGASRGAALFGGITYGLSGYLVDISNNWLYLMSAATFPWVLWATFRFFQRPSAARLLVAALLHVSILFAGDPQSFAITGAAMVLLALVPMEDLPRRKRLLRLGLLLISAALLSAPQLLPALHTRSIAMEGRTSLEIAQVYSLHPLRLLELVLGPLFFDSEAGAIQREVARAVEPRMRGFWVGSIGIGAVSLVMAFFGFLSQRQRPQAWWLAATGVLTCALALGIHTPIYGWFYEVIPLWQGFRYPEKLVPFGLFTLALGAAVGVSTLEARPELHRALRLALVGAALMLGIVGVAAGPLGPWLLSALGDIPSAVSISSTLRRLAFAASAAAALSAGMLALPAPRGLAGLIVIQVALLAVIHAPLPKTSAVDVLETPSPFVLSIEQEQGGLGIGGARVLSAVERWHRQPAEGLDATDLETAYQAAALLPSIPALFDLESANFYLPATSPRVLSAYLTTGAWFHRLAALYGTPYFVVDEAYLARAAVPEDDIVSVVPALGVGMFRRNDARPRAYLAQPRCLHDAKTALREVTTGAPLAEGQAWMEGCERPLPGQVPEGRDLGTISEQVYAPEAARFTVAVREASFLVVNDAHYPGWSASVNGEPAPIHVANYAVRGIPLEPGEHRVEFTYRTPYLRGGLAIGVATLLCLLVLVGRELRTRRIHSESASA